ncbi:MAG TPA: PEP-CTERM sorting domain-containing protein [Pyrinomonadaceae bacterium]|nr:PEP-CTERM sorting domain-containing protein [Pyrinomonadaceae bacterium]
MRYRAFRPTAAILSVLLLAGVPTHAAPIVFSDVIQVLRNNQNPPELRLRSVYQNPTLPDSWVQGSLQQSLRDGPLKIATGPSDPNLGSVLAGVAIDQDPQKIDVIAQGDVEGTVCDCGDIFVAGGGWPKWPLLFLGAIPFFFIDDDCDNCDRSSPTPTPTPTPTPPPPPPTPTPPVPEPGSLLLFGTGLAAFGAVVRRRYSRSRLMAQIHSTKKEG